MKILSSKVGKDPRKRIVSVEIDEYEMASGYTLLAIRHDSFYKLGGDVDYVVGAHVLTEMDPVTWCSVEQKWV